MYTTHIDLGHHALTENERVRADAAQVRAAASAFRRLRSRQRRIPRFAGASETGGDEGPR